MRKTTIRKSLEEAATNLDGIATARVTQVTCKIAKSPKGNRKVVSARLTMQDTEGVAWSLNISRLDSRLLRGTASAKLSEWIAGQFATTGTTAASAKPTPRIRDIAAGTQTGPVCGEPCKDGSKCARPSADGSACWQHGGDSARRGLVARDEGNVRDHSAATTSLPGWLDDLTADSGRTLTMADFDTA